MNVYIPEWVFFIPLVWVVIGILLWPVCMVKVHKALSHNVGWTWKTTIFGRRFNIFRFTFGTIAAVVLWPWALKEAFSL